MTVAHHASTQDRAAPDTALHSHGDTHGHGSRRGYLTGFVLSAILTAIPFWLVMSGAIVDRQTAVLIVVALAIVQIVVHTVAFLHVNSKAENGWTLMATVFTAVLVAITICGSLWIMYHLNTNMMPIPTDASAM